MKKITQKLLILALCSSLFISCSTHEDMEELVLAERTADIAISYNEIEHEIIDLINNYRIENGLTQLNVMNVVSKEAGNHTDYMVEIGSLSHDNFGLRHQNLVKNASAISVAENVAYGYSSAKSAVNAWIKSPRHEQNIANDSYTDFGISIKSDDNGRYYFTNIFIKK